MRSKASLILSVFILLSISLLTSCSTGSSGGGGPGVDQTQEVKVSGAVSIDGSPPDQSMTVKIVSINSNGTKVDTQTVNTVYSRTNPALNGNFQATVKAKKGGKIIVTAKGSQTTEAGRVIEFKGQKELTVNLQANTVTTQTVNLSNGLVINSTGKRYVRIALTKDRRGSPKLVAGLKAQNTPGKVIDIAIPVSALNSNTTTVNVSYRAFDPSNPDDYRSFPGDRTDSGDRLVSIGFDYLDITDQNGNNPFQSDGLNSQLVSGEYFRILRYVDCNQIQNIRNMLGSLDEDPSKPGVQLTFYAFDFDQGSWVEAGQGTFVDTDTIDFTNTEWDTIIQSGCDPSSSSTDNNDGSAGCSEYGIFTDENDICTDYSDFVVVSVTNPDLQWKNLDYVVPEGRELSCTVKVVNQNNDPVPGAWVSASSSCMSFAEGVTDQNGEVELIALGYTDPCLAQVDAWYLMNTAGATANFDSGNQCQITLILENPYECTVSGKVVDESNQPVEGFIVGTVVANPSGTQYYYNWGITDSQGNFSIPTVCGGDGVVYAKNTFKAYNVNNQRDFDEVSDNGTEADVGIMQIINDPPYGYMWLFYQDQFQAGDQFEVGLCAYDMENDYDISYTIYRDASSGNTIFASGTISMTNSCVYNYDTLTGSNSPQCYRAVLRDSKGNEAYATTDNCISADNSGNYLRMTISGSGYYSFYYNSTYVYVSVELLGTGTLSVQSASYDCDGHTGNFDLNAGRISSNFYSWSICNDSTYCQGIIPNIVNGCSVTVTATNGSQTITHTKDISIFSW